MRKKPNKKKLQSENTKRLLYDHATKLIKEKGYYNVPIEEITEAAGVSVGAFYHHFRSKDELVLLWADDIDKKYSDFYDEIKLNPNYKNVLDKIRMMIYHSLEIYSSLGKEFTEVTYSYMMREPKAAARMLDPHRSFFRAMNELVEQGKIERKIRNNISSKQIVQDIVMATRGAILDWCISGDIKSITERSTTFINSYIDGITK